MRVSKIPSRVLPFTEAVQGGIGASDAVEPGDANDEEKWPHIKRSGAEAATSASTPPKFGVPPALYSRVVVMP